MDKIKKTNKLTLKWKIFIGFVATIFTLLLIAIAILLSPVGLKLALSIAKDALPGQLTYTDVTGKPLGPITFTNFSYSQDGNTFSAKRIHLSWQRLGFAELNLWIKKIEITDAKLTTTVDVKDWLKAQSQHKQTVKTQTKKTKPWVPFWLHSNLRVQQLSANDFTWFDKNNKKLWDMKSLTGHIDLGKKRLDSNIDMVVVFPQAAHINFKTQGKPSNYSMLLSATGPKTALNIKGNGDEKHINIATTKNELWGGSLTGTTKISWKPELSWGLAWQATNINPSMIWKKKHSPIRLPSNISMQISAQGVGQQGNVNWKNVKMKLADQMFYGQGSITFHHDVIDTIATNISSKYSKLFLNGAYQGGWALKWRINMDDLNIFSEHLTGTINADGQLLGKRDTPKLIGTLSANNISWKGAGYKKISATWDVDSSQQQPAIMNVNIQGALHKTQILQNSRLILSGTLSQHKLLFLGNTPNSSWTISIKGQNTPELWSGTLSNWNITDSTTHEKWTLAQPVPMSYDKNGFKIQNLKLYNKNSNLQFSANLQDLENSQIHMQVHSWPLHSFQPWAPPILKMGGRISGKTDIVIDNGLLKKLSSNWTFGKGVWRLKPRAIGGDLKFHVNYASVAANLFGSTLKIKIKGGINKNSNWELDLNIPKYTRIHLPAADQVISGSLHISSTELNFLQTAIPNIDQLHGELMANCKLTGSWAQPELFGKLQIKDGHVVLTNYGITLNNIAADVNTFGQILKFKLVGYSDGKPITLAGSGTFVNKDIYIQAKLTGNDVLIWNDSDYTFYATPNLNFNLQNKHLKLTGDVLLPRGSIHPKSLASTQYLSEDTVIVKKKKDDSTPFTVDSDLKVTAGKNLQINANGINGNVTGNLHVVAGTHKVTVADGRLSLQHGTYTIQGKTLDLSRGEVNFRRSPLDNPFLNISAARTIQQSDSDIGSRLEGPITVGLNITGTLKKPIINFFSTPSTLSQSEILSYLTFGQPTASTLNLLSQAASALSSTDDSDQGGLASEIQQGLDLKEFGFEPSQQSDPLGAPLEQKDAFVIGRNFGKRIYIRYSPSSGRLNKTNEVIIRYQINNRWSIQTDLEADSTDGKNPDYGADLFYSIEKN